MHIPKNYFRDKSVLLLLGVNAFLALLGILLILLRLDAGRPDDYIVEYRSNLGLSAFKSGGAGTILSFALFSLLVLVFHTVLSMRVYVIRRHFAVTVLAFGLLLLLLSIIVSNALLVLR
jgi:hypothetical protein